ncbi:hypothetical protein FS842_005924 [Serendipita sp. 407]|nr:hypothetical protein FS842_005924 [Serendipita sp. 407]
MEVEETPKEHAARLGMFGTMTREQKDWSPARLLCKRFKVPPPKVTAPDPAEDTNSLDQYTNNAPAEPLQTMQVDFTSEEPTIRVVAAEGDGQKRNIDNIGLGEDDSQGQDTLTYERPSMDIFKAIFASDEESDDEPDDEPEPPSSLTPLRLDDATIAPLASQRTKAVAVNEPVDLSTFKPTFISRTDREKRKQVDGGGDVVKVSKKKNKSQGPVSFMEDDEAELTVVPAAKKRKRPKDGDSKSGKKLKSAAAADVTQMMIDDEDDDSMWVEKEIPLAAPVPPSSTSIPPKNETIVPGKSRPKAADFL